MVNAVTDGNQAGGEQAGSAFGPGEKVLEHFVVGPAGLLAHIDISHGSHNQPVLNGHAVDPDRGKHRGVRVEILRHSGTARADRGVVGDPAAVAVYQALYESICFHGGIPPSLENEYSSTMIVSGLEEDVK